MPPGVNPSDIPGNRPEDEAEDLFWESVDQLFYERYPQYQEALRYITNGYSEAFYAYVELARDMGYDNGRAETENELAIAKSYESELDEKEKQKWQDANAPGEEEGYWHFSP